MNLSNPFRGAAGEVVDNIIDFIAAKINALWQIQHDSDGAHTDITADSLTLGSDPNDGSWSGNVGASLVPTVTGCDLGANITLNSTVSKTHPFRNILLSGNVNWGSFSDSVIGGSAPSITRTGNALAVAGAGNVAGGTVTIVGNGAAGAQTTLTVSSAGVTSTTSVSATTFLAAPILILTDGITAPSTLAGFAQIYVDTADGDLKVKFGDGTVKTIVVDT